jgi:putative spermidine/putrescine transport system ATP-binding protein
MTASLSIEQLSFRYRGTTAGVAGIDLAVRERELVAVMGPSGCGKSTLLKLVGGFLFPQAGRIGLGGVDMTAAAPAKRGLGIVFQSLALFPHLRAWENVAFPLKMRRMALVERRRAAHEAIERVGLAGFAERRPGELSGGQQQRVALARALVFRPRALLLDEPLSALDAATRIAMRDEIRRIQQDYGVAALHITHDQEEALSIADRVAVMRSGRIEQVDTPEAIYDRPANRFVAGFVGHANLWDGTIAGPDAVATPLGTLRTGCQHRAAGARVAVLVRPEHVRLGPGGGDANRFAGSVARDRFLGAQRRFDFAVAGGTLAGTTSIRGPITAVHVGPEHVTLLDSDGTDASTST